VSIQSSIACCALANPYLAHLIRLGLVAVALQVQHFFDPAFSEQVMTATNAVLKT
jgi:hypothetical protein